MVFSVLPQYRIHECIVCICTIFKRYVWISIVCPKIRPCFVRMGCVCVCVCEREATKQRAFWPLSLSLSFLTEKSGTIRTDTNRSRTNTTPQTTLHAALANTHSHHDTTRDETNQEQGEEQDEKEKEEKGTKIKSSPPFLWFASPFFHTHTVPIAFIHHGPSFQTQVNYTVCMHT